MACKLCKHWAPPADPKQGGNCKRFPPVPFLQPVQTLTGPSVQLIGLFPPTSSEEQCGEFSIKSFPMMNE